jgi:hypothetical protein
VRTCGGLKKGKMAIYHLSAKIISRSSGRSATGASAYRSGTEITDERTGLVHDYRKKSGVDFTTILSQENAPEWVSDRTRLWNEVEKAEKRKDAQLCREVEVAFPVELDFEEKQKLISSFVQDEFVKKGMIADVAIHHANGENPHAHILLTTREIMADGFGQKNRSWNQKEMLQEWRQAWQDYSNRALEQAGHSQRIDHRTLEAQGIERAPQIHLGAKVIEMEQRGQRTERGTTALTIEQTNAQIIELSKYREELASERHPEIETSAEYRRVGNGDRAVGASLGQLGGRNQPGHRSHDGQQPETSRGVEQTPETDRRSMASIGQGHAGSRESIGLGGGHGTESSQELDVKSLVRGDSRVNSAYSGAFDRILALSGTTNDDTERDDMAGHETERKPLPIDRTYLAAKRQIEAMNCGLFEVGIRNQAGKMLIRSWDKVDILNAIPWLKRENAKGADIYVRPAGDKNQGLILVDDLNQAQIGRMKADGYEPAVTVETSPQNYQAWIRLGQTTLEPDTATVVSKALAKRYEADPNSADWRHFGRLAGFTNRKPEYTNENGENPWVLCHEASGKQASKGLEAVEKARKGLTQLKLEQERKRRVEGVKNAPERVLGRDPVFHYQKQLRSLMAKYGAKIDYSRADYMIVLSMAKQGYGQQELVKTLELASPELPKRKAGHELDYCQRTVKAVFDSPEITKHLELERNRGKDKGHGFSR